MDPVDKAILKELGMTNNEVEIYLSLLTHGSVTVNRIAEKTGFHRQACYDSLERLLEKGFVNYVLTNNKKHFQAKPPRRLVAYAEEMKTRLNEMLPRLEALTTQSEEKSFVEVHRGKNVMRTILRGVISDMRDGIGPVLISGVDEEKFLEYDEGAIEKYINDLRKFGFKEKLLAQEGTRIVYPGKQSEYRFLPREFFNPNPTFIYGSKVVFVIWGSPLYGVVIRNQEIADANRKQFNLLWGIAKRSKGPRD